MRPDYILSKHAATYAFSLLADGVKPDALQVVSYHPGMIYTDAWPPLGFTKDMLPFDEGTSLPTLLLCPYLKRCTFTNLSSRAPWQLRRLGRVQGGPFPPRPLRLCYVGR